MIWSQVDYDDDGDDVNQAVRGIHDRLNLQSVKENYGMKTEEEEKE